jgi:hypothetical protein
MGEMKNTNKSVLENHKRRDQLGRPSYRWEDGINVDLEETAFENMDWNYLSLNRWCALVNTLMNLLFP